MFWSTALVYLTGYKGFSKDAVVMYVGEWSLCMDFYNISYFGPDGPSC